MIHLDVSSSVTPPLLFLSPLILTALSNLLLPVITHAPVEYLHTYWGLPYTQVALVHVGLLFVFVVFLIFSPPRPPDLCASIRLELSGCSFLLFCHPDTVGQGGKALGMIWSATVKENSSSHVNGMVSKDSHGSQSVTCGTALLSHSLYIYN